MMITIAIQSLDSGEVCASAPDLPGCTVRDATVSGACARIRLAVEGALADLLLAGEPVPIPRSGREWRGESRFRDARWLEVHINMRHIEALARHQARDPIKGATQP